MKSAFRICVLTLFMVVPFATAQDKPVPPPAGTNVPVLTAKDTEASKHLNELAKDQAEDTKHLNDVFQQARTILDQNQKALNDELANSQKALDAKLANDKKYRDDIAHIESLKKQITDAGAKAQNDFMKTIGPIQQKLQTESIQVQGLIPVVRSENGFSATSQFDVQTQKWSDIPPPKK